MPGRTPWPPAGGGRMSCHSSRAIGAQWHGHDAQACRAPWQSSAQCPRGAASSRRSRGRAATAIIAGGGDEAIAILKPPGHCSWVRARVFNGPLRRS
jgi:hypothetical protein